MYVIPLREAANSSKPIIDQREIKDVFSCLDCITLANEVFFERRSIFSYCGTVFFIPGVTETASHSSSRCFWWTWQRKYWQSYARNGSHLHSKILKTRTFIMPICWQAPYLSFYKVYAGNYNSAVSLCRKLSKKESFALFCEVWTIVVLKFSASLHGFFFQGEESKTRKPRTCSGITAH